MMGEKEEIDHQFFFLTNIKENLAIGKSCLKKSNGKPIALCQFTYTSTKPVWKSCKGVERNTQEY